MGIAAAKSETRVVQLKGLTKGQAVLLLVLSALGAIASVTFLHGRQVFVGLAVVGVILFVGFLLWNRKQ